MAGSQRCANVRGAEFQDCEAGLRARPTAARTTGQRKQLQRSAGKLTPVQGCALFYTRVSTLGDK